MSSIDAPREHMRALVDGKLDPLHAGELICAEALGRRGGQWPWLWLLWATLGSLQPSTGTAEDEMRRAAGEWLELSSDEALWRAYFERWLGCVYSSPSLPGEMTGVPHVEPAIQPPRKPVLRPVRPRRSNSRAARHTPRR